ncbi:MAG TPA: hypothetical protein VFH08_05415 [Chitinophagaceae bacterium]|nr:hypothetical protein [Chitinophagaceae bacterium]
MKRSFFPVLLLFGIINGFGQKPVQKWKKYALPNGDAILQYSNSATSWLVSLDSSGQVIAQNRIAKVTAADTLPFKPYFDTMRSSGWKGFRTVKRVDNGYLVGFNKGEFGGSLYWFSETGDTSYQIARVNVDYIFEYKKRVYMTNGLFHRSTDLGKINEMRFADGKWKVEESLELPSKSNIIMPYKDRMLIVTTKTILFFDGTNNFDFIKKDGFWSTLYPQSAVMLNDELFVGMRGGVYKINLQTKKEEWLMPK